MPGETEGVRRVRDATVWQWFADRVLMQRMPWASPGCVLPADFDAVVRVLHPAQDGSTWAQVAAESGRIPHALMQWGHIEQRCGRVYGVNSGAPLVYGDRVPEAGDPPTSLVEVLLDCCPASDEVFFGVWVGYGGWSDPMDDDVLALPHREYRIFRGPKMARRTWPGMDAGSRQRGQAANLIWPADRSWVIVSEIDWMFTLVAGSAHLAERILADPRVEAYRVDFDMVLDARSDTVNAPFVPRLGLLGQQGNFQVPGEDQRSG